MHLAILDHLRARDVGRQLSFGALMAEGRDLFWDVRASLGLGRFIALQTTRPPVCDSGGDGFSVVVHRGGDHVIRVRPVDGTAWMVHVAGENATDEDQLLLMLPARVYNVPRTAGELFAAVAGWEHGCRHLRGPPCCGRWPSCRRCWTRCTATPMSRCAPPCA